MKYLLLIALLLPTTAWADIEFQITNPTRLVDDDLWTTESWVRLQGNYVFDNDVYIFGSTEDFHVSHYSKAFSYNVVGLGAGIKHRLSEGLSLFGQMGYYVPKNSWGRRREHNESLHNYLNSRWNQIQDRTFPFETYTVENEDTIGITLGFQIDKAISENWRVGFVGSYRAFQINETISAELDHHNFPVTGNRYEIGETRNYSTFNLGLTLAYSF